MNLSEFVDNPYTSHASFNWGEFSKGVEIAIKALDEIVDENLPNHPLKEQRENARNYRNVGLGVFGYANMLFKLGMTYGSKQAINFTSELFNFMLSVALHTTNNLAKEKGAFPKCKADKIVKATILQEILEKYPNLKESILKYGIRNCSLLSVAPAGSIGSMVGMAGSAEPEFALKYTRHTDNLNDSYEVYSQSIREYWDVNGECSYDELPSYFVTSKDIPWRNRIDTQATIQKYVDTAISSTVNLPREIKVDEIEELYLYAWKQGLKGVTVYRSGCAREGILTTNETIYSEPTTNSTDDLPWGTVIKPNADLMGFKTKIVNGCGSFHLQTFFDEADGRPWETFINLSHGAGCERNIEFISKLISKCLRAGVPIEDIIETAKEGRPCLSYCNRTKTKGDTSKGVSCPTAIGHALEAFNEKIKEYCIADFDEYEWDEPPEEIVPPQENEDDNTPRCPECGSKLSFEGGCNVCRGDETHNGCGWSKCD